ncbi:MAG TPA: hypothetical protein VNR18_05220 [Hyphomicrobiales bacterium]|nr:hypothetical protein [Hyphomicrobiales bacterium]
MNTRILSRSLLPSLAFAACGELPAQPIQPGELPEGEGKSLVQTVCFSCHTAVNITTSAGYEAAAWKDVFGSMVTLPQAQADTIAQYLAGHYPPRPDRAPTLVSGPLQIDIQEWTVPTRGQRSRDPVEAQDGSIWWTGMWASLVGRIDPATGAMEEYHLPFTARPHSIVPGADGSIWYTGNGNGTIGRLDPATGLITQFDTRAADPHSAVFHPNGKLFFTAQNSGMLGRLDPATGELQEIDTEPRPYGIKVAPSGTLWIAYNGTNKIGAMDPETLEVRYYDIPNTASRIRRLDIDSQGTIWYVNSTQGKIGRLNPANGEIKEWDSPSGPRSHPYAIAVVNDKVWYNESGMRPDALVRFDPETETFQSWAIPSGVGIVRNMWVTRDNNLLIHQSSTNRVGLVTIPD